MKFFKLLKKVFVVGFGGSLIGISGYVAYTQNPIANKSSIIYAKSSNFNEKIVESLLPIDYIPTFYLPSCLLQMIYNELKTKVKVSYKREYLETDDEGLISLDWGINPNQTIEETLHPQKLLVILHGLTGGSEAAYIREIVDKFFEDRSYKVVVVQYRGINGCPLITPKSFHIGETSDITFAMNHIRQLYPDTPCYVLGTSMGANIFTKLLSQNHEFDDYIKAFVSISNPLNINVLEERNRGSVLDYFLYSRQIKFVERHYGILKNRPDLEFEKILNAKRHRDFDEHYTCKMFNFPSVDEYYKYASCHNELVNLKVPSLFMHSRNDKISPIDQVDLTQFEKNEKLILVVTEKGGHVCWFQGVMKPERWFIKKSMIYFDKVHELLGLSKHYSIDNQCLDFVK